MSEKIARAIEACIQQDPGRRGVTQWACRAELLPATVSLFRSRRVLITTGFYILSAGVIETDGPPGAIILASALRRLGKPVSILVDDHAAGIIRCGLDFIDSDVPVVQIAPGRAIEPRSVLLDDTSHFVAIERPGRSKDGRYYNFARKDITAYVAPVDDLFVHARKNGIVTIGIGDGGNELGMQCVASRVDRHLAYTPPISCRVAADYCICAGVSNWGGYGMAALLSHLAGKNLLPPFSRLMELIWQIVKAGAVDGISARQRATVDGLAPFWEYDIYAKVNQLASD